MLHTIGNWVREHVGWVLVSISAAGQVVSDQLLSHEDLLRVSVLLISGVSVVVQLWVTALNRWERARINAEHERKLGLMRTAPDLLDDGE